MNKHLARSLLLAGGLAAYGQVQADIVFFTQSNTSPDGSIFATAEIVAVGDNIQFTVTPNDALFSNQNNFGLQVFSLNTDGIAISNYSATNFLLPVGWSADFVRETTDGFGDFDIKLNGSGGTRQDPLVFQITGINGDTPLTYTSEFSAGSAGSGNAILAARVAGYCNDGPCGPGLPGVGSEFIGAVPIPTAVWLLGSGLIGLLGIARRTVVAA
jgi:hypothetical protein